MCIVVKEGIQSQWRGVVYFHFQKKEGKKDWPVHYNWTTTVKATKWEEIKSNRQTILLKEKTEMLYGNIKRLSGSRDSERKAAEAQE